MKRNRMLFLVPLGGAALLLAAVYWLSSSPPDGAGRSSVGEKESGHPTDGGPLAGQGELFAGGEEAAEEQANPTPAIDLRESFDRVPATGLPAGWSRWSNDTDSTLGASGERALSAPQSLAITGHTNAVARAWPATPVAADVQASSAILLSTLIPAQVLVRGTGLNTAAPNYYAVSVARGLEVQLLRVVKGNATVLGTVKSAAYFSQKWVRVTISASGNSIRAQVFRPDTSQYLNAAGQWQAAAAWALSATDAQITGAGQIALAKGTGYAGTIYFDDFTVQKPEGATPPPDNQPPQPPPPQPLPRPTIPRHYEHIRIGMLMYAGTPFGTLEEQLLRSSVDLVIPNPAFLERISKITPRTPQLIYTNTSNLYLDLLTDWLAYADRKGLPREAAFYHVTRPIPFRGDSASSRAVNMFWAVYRGGQTLTDMTSAAHSGTGKVSFGASGESVYIGYPDRFREINVRLVSGAAGGWSAALEYPSGVDAAGAVTRWAPLPTLSDTTARLSRPGVILFDPPADWKPASVNGSARLFYVRFRTTAGGTAPVAAQILGRDYVGANGTKAGVIPVFDLAADTDKDGYLNDAEYLKRAPGKDARFFYESRMYTEGYGQMRPATNPSSPAFRGWAVDYHVRFLARHPLASGLFMDNAGGKAPAAASDVLEPVANYANDSGLMLAAVAQAIAPRWVLANVGGAQTRADPIIAHNPAYFEEYGIRPMSHNWAFFEDLANLVARRAALATPAPIAVLDSHPQRGTPTDPRMQMGVLAYYYLIADPEWTFLVFFGGYEPATTWARHWVPAVVYNIGKPTGKWSQRATGPDPSNPALSYRLYQRVYERALVLYKPLSHARGSTVTASLGDETATTHDLGGTYRPLRPDATLGAPITSITLRNGEGAILIKQ